MDLNKQRNIQQLLEYYIDKFTYIGNLFSSLPQNPVGPGRLTTLFARIVIIRE